MNRLFRTGLCLMLFLLTAGCASPSPQPDPTPTTSPTLTAEPTAIPEPSATAEPDPAPTPGVETGQRAFFSEAAQRNYWLFLPSSYGKDPQKKWPLILFLHGAGTRGTDINLLKFEALPQVLDFTPDFPFIVVSPQLTNEGGDDYWFREKAGNSVMTLLDEVQSTYAVDPKRVYLTGVSIGGNGAWVYGLQHPERFAALAPVMGFYGDTGGTYVPETICDLKDVPVWAFHGAKDPIVPLEAEQGLVDALKACGGNVQFTVYPDGDHDISGRVYNNNTEFFEWLAAQSLK